jgi:hypothetical protein
LLSTPIENRSIKSSAVVGEFIRNLGKNAPAQDQLKEAKREYQIFLLDELFDFSILLRSLFSCLKISNEYKTVLAGVTPTLFGRIIDAIKAEITGIADKFTLQRGQIIREAGDLETNALLQERIAKAAGYFSEKIENLITQPLQTVAIETDNREARKALQKALEAVLKEATEKLYCLNACRSGLVFADFLKQRAQSLFQGPAAKPARQKEDRGAVSDTFSHPELYARLKQWRAAKAKETGQPAFLVLHNTTLAEISERLPVTMEELVVIKGLKSKKGKTLGPELLQMVDQYRKEHHLPDRQIVEQNENIQSEKEKPRKPKTKEETLRLFLEGRTAAQVASLRNLTLTTIEGHLAYFVGTGSLILDQLMSQEKATRITAYFLSNPYQGLTQAKEDLGDDVSYGELRFVLKNLERQGKL